MKHCMYMTLLAAIAGLFVVGCAGPQEKSLSALKKHVANLQKSFADDTDTISDVSYDVQKTDSVVSPFIGKIEYEVQPYDDDEGKPYSFHYEFKLTLAYQESRWVIKEAIERTMGQGQSELWEPVESFRDIPERLGIQ